LDISELFPLDVRAELLAALEADDRPFDGKLHPSSHLLEPLRHVQLEFARAPQKPRTLPDRMPLEIGTLLHERFERIWRKKRLPIMLEVKLDEWLPDGWSGTADWIPWSKEHRAFVLGDLKTLKGAGLPWILRDGAKESHLWQISAYWYALRDMGIPLVEGFAIAYLPKDGGLEPEVMDCKMIDESLLRAVMDQRKADVDAFLAFRDECENEWPKGLAPIPDREQKRVWNAKAKTLDVVLKPHWSSMYCRFLDCGCSEQGQEKIGTWESIGGIYSFTPRNGYETPEYLETPSEREFKS